MNNKDKIINEIQKIRTKIITLDEFDETSI